MEYSVKYIYRCDDISSVDTFLSLRDVLKLEMFGDGSGIRNFEGVVADLERLFPEINIPEYDIEQLENDEQAEITFVDGVLDSLEKDCNVSRKNFKYAIWGCDTAQGVVDSYGLDDSYEINKYRLKNAVVFQDLGVEGQLYGVNEYPECMYTESEKEINMKESAEELYNRIYEECVCAAGASGISSMAPQHMMACVDQKDGDVSRFTGGNGGRKVQSEKDVLFKNDSMNVHKRKGKKGDAITGTGIVYANGKYMENLKESLDHVFESFDWDDEIYERKRDGLPTECCNCGADCTDSGKIIGGDVYCLSCAEHELCESTETIDLNKSKIVETKRDLNGKIESNHEGSLGDWTDQDSLVFAYDLLDKGEGDLDERAILKELYRAPYFKDLFDEIEKEEERIGGSTNNTVGWDNVASEELEHAAKEVHKILQDLKNK